MINRKLFYTEFRNSFGTFTNKQLAGFEAIFNQWDKRAFSDLRWLAYMLATAWHETAKSMQPIEEFGKGKGRKYGSKAKHSGVSYILPNKIYYGRGFVQLTWFENYELMGRLLKLDLLKNPELCLTVEVAVAVMFEGMLNGSSNIGDFTGKCLEMYFNDTTCNPVSARKIINGTDCAEKIAEEFAIFFKCLAVVR